MIVKKVRNPKKSSSKSSRISGLTNYVREPETENKLEKCIHTEAENFISDTPHGQTAEMIALASEAVKSKDPIDHWVLSWKANEQPTIEQAREAVQIFIHHCGLDGHQYIWGLHDDTENLHIHISVNRVNPDTLKVTKINKGFDLNAGHEAIALIEHKQGWSKENDARYDITNGKPVLRKRDADKPLKPNSHSLDMEEQTGAKSEQRIGIERAAPIIQQAKTWKELHASLAAIGMEYRREGSGAKVYVDGNATGVKASDVDRKASFSALQKRLGSYQPSQEINQNDYHNTNRNFNNSKIQNALEIGKNTGHSLRNLSKCTLAHNKEGRQNHGTRVLSIDARADRRAAGGLRRDTGRDNPRSGRVAEPIKQGQPGWKEYQSIKEEQRTLKATATGDLSKQQSAERTALFARLKAERVEALNGNWKGKGNARNVLQSLIAIQQSDARFELSERHKGQRKELQEQFKPLPQYKTWKEQPQIVCDEEPLIITEQKKAAAEEPTPPRLSSILRDLTHTKDMRNHLTYSSQGRTIFRDEGKVFAVLDHSDNGIAATLISAQQKFGNKLTLTGSPEFQENCVRVAVKNGIAVRFADPELENLRQMLLNEHKMRAAHKAVKLAVAPAPEHQVAKPTPTPAPVQVPDVKYMPESEVEIDAEQHEAEPQQDILDEMDELESAIYEYCSSTTHQDKPIVEFEGKPTSRASGIVVAVSENFYAVAGSDKITIHPLSAEVAIKTDGTTSPGDALVPGQNVSVAYSANGIGVLISIKEQRPEHKIDRTNDFGL